VSGLRCLALDADPVALAEVKYLLQTDNRVTSVESAGEIHHAADIIKHESVDAVFVCLLHHSPTDIQQLLLSCASKPRFVALARDDAMAKQAFEVGAVDFIIKPLSRQSLERAIVRLGESHATTPRRLKVETSNGAQFIDLRDIHHIEANGDYSCITTSAGRFVSRQSLTMLAEALADAGFLRVHRGWIVPVHRVERLTQECGKVALTVAGHEIPVARRATRTVKDHLGC